MENDKTVKVKFKYTPKGYGDMGILLKYGCEAETSMSLSHDDHHHHHHHYHHHCHNSPF